MNESMIPSDYEEEEDAPRFRPSATSPHCAPTGVYVSSEEDEDEFDEGSTLFCDRRDQRMIGGDEAEATLSDLRSDEAMSILKCANVNDLSDACLVDALVCARKHRWR